MAQEAVALGSTPETIKVRIDVMFARDKMFALTLVAILWLTVFFVMFQMRVFIPDPAIEVACWLVASVLLLFNTGSILAMFKHYAQDKAHIYSVDIRHLDAGH